MMVITLTISERNVNRKPECGQGSTAIQKTVEHEPIQVSRTENERPASAAHKAQRIVPAARACEAVTMCRRSVCRSGLPKVMHLRANVAVVDRLNLLHGGAGKRGRSAARILSSACAGRLAPGTVQVTASDISIQRRAICAIVAFDGTSGRNSSTALSPISKSTPENVSPRSNAWP